MNYRPKHVAEYLALRALSVLVNALPYRLALCVGWGVARLGFLVMASRVRSGRERIRCVFGAQLEPADERRILWESWRNVAFNAVELLRVGKMSASWLASVVDSSEAVRTLTAHTKTGRGAVIAVPHMGNWDLGAISGHLHGIPIFTIAAVQKNPLVNAYINRLRAQPGIETLMRGSGAMRGAIRRLRAGGILAILPDVRSREPGVLTPFLGGEANLATGMALFARHANVPIFPSYVRRCGWARHELHVGDPVWSDPTLPKQDDVRRVTHLVMERINAWILATPGQWFWFNKRWILDPLSPALDTAVKPPDHEVCEPAGAMPPPG